jgi:hypothetical protein
MSESTSTAVGSTDWVAAARTCETLANEIDVLLKTVGTETMRELTNLSDDRHALWRAARALQTKAATSDSAIAVRVSNPATETPPKE